MRVLFCHAQPVTVIHSLNWADSGSSLQSFVVGAVGGLRQLRSLAPVSRPAASASSEAAGRRAGGTLASRAQSEDSFCSITQSI